jgi:plasmid stability protein
MSCSHAVAEDRIIVTENADDFRKLATSVELRPGLIILPSVSRLEAQWLMDLVISCLIRLNPDPPSGCGGEFDADDHRGGINSDRSAAVSARSDYPTYRASSSLPADSADDACNVIIAQVINRPGLSSMPSLTIRNIEESLKSRLRVRAAAHGRSMEEEAHAILSAAFASEAMEEKGLGSVVSALFRPLGGVDLELPAKEPT